METTAFLVWNRTDLLKKKCEKISLFVVMLKRYSFIIISNQAPNFQTGRLAFKPGGEMQNQIQTGRTARLKRAGENPEEATIHVWPCLMAPLSTFFIESKLWLNSG